MIHFDEVKEKYYLMVKGANIQFPDMGSMIKFAQEKYNINLLEQLN